MLEIGVKIVWLMCRIGVVEYLGEQRGSLAG